MLAIGAIFLISFFAYIAIVLIVTTADQLINNCVDLPMFFSN